MRPLSMTSLVFICLGYLAAIVCAQAQEVVNQSAASQQVINKSQEDIQQQSFPQQPFQQPPIDQQPEVNSQCKNYAKLYQDIALNKTSRVEIDPLEGLEGKTINNITFKTMDVFDKDNPRENNKLYLFLNKLHINTKPHVVESQLLFHKGSNVNIKEIHESERILRTRKYFSNAYILPESVCGDQVNLLVVTQDAWAVEPQFSFSRNSGNNETGFGISDGNILGSGNALTIAYSENQQRNGIGYDFSNPYFLNRPIDLRLYYEDTNDGRNSIVDISRPFYALDTPWATGMRLDDVSLVETIRSRGEVINEFRHQALLNEVFIGKATDVTPDHTQRWLVGFTNEEQKFYATPDTSTEGVPVHDKAAYPWVEYQYLENKFGVYKNINQIQRPEDIALGQNFTFRLGFGGKTFDNPDDVVRFKSEYVNIIDVHDVHIFEYSVKVDGKQHLQISDLDPVIISSYMSYNYFQDEKNRWYSRISYDVGQDLSQQEELTVGDITGLRGYPTDYVRGKKRYVFTLERRYFSDIHLFNLLRMGGAIYFDAGKAWGLESDPSSPLLSDIGFGLRFSSTKVRIGNVVHIDVAMPMAMRTGISKYQLIIGAEKKF